MSNPGLLQPTCFQHFENRCFVKGLSSMTNINLLSHRDYRKIFNLVCTVATLTTITSANNKYPDKTVQMHCLAWYFVICMQQSQFFS